MYKIQLNCPSLNLFLAAPAWVSNPGPLALNASTLPQSHSTPLCVVISQLPASELSTLHRLSVQQNIVKFPRTS